MATQIQYGDWKTNNINLTMPRGDTRKYTFTHDLGPSSAIKEARFQIRDADDVSLVSLSLDSNPTQFDFTTDDECVVTISAANTVGVAIAGHRYALELVNQTDLVNTPWIGGFSITDDVVDDGETAAHLSWGTRTTLDAEIDVYEAQVIGMASAADVTYLSAAASLGAATVDVVNGAIYLATQTIRIMLDDGTYDEEVIVSMSTNEITLTGTLTSAAAAGKVVMRVV